MEASSGVTPGLEARKAETVSRFVRAWETGDFGELVSMLTEDAVLTMPPWVYWLDGRDAIAATMQSPGTSEGEPRPGRYRIVPCGMNGQPAGLAYVRFGDGPYVAVCMTVMTRQDQISTAKARHENERDARPDRGEHDQLASVAWIA